MMLKLKARQLVKDLPFSDLLRDTYFARMFGQFFGVPSALNYQLKVANFAALFRSLPVRYVFDIGANIGDTCSIYSAAGCTVLAVEPDPQNLKRLSSRFQFNKNVTMIPCGVGSAPGRLRLNCYSATGAHDTFSEKRKHQLQDTVSPPLGIPINPSHSQIVEVTTLDLLIKQYGIPDYVKVDVEGFELEVLSGLSQPIKAISFESILPCFLEETIECLNRLEALSDAYKFNYWSVKHDYALQSQRWLDKAEIMQLVTSGSLPFMDILAIMMHPTSR